MDMRADENRERVDPVLSEEQYDEAERCALKDEEISKIANWRRKNMPISPPKQVTQEWRDKCIEFWRQMDSSREQEDKQ
jgi:hypothetical protein